MNMHNLMRESPGIAVTAARYGMAERMAHKVRNELPIVLDTAVFIAADIADGVVLRRFGLDTPARRTTGGVVDVLSVTRVGYETARQYPDSRRYMGILAARAIAVGGLNVIHYATTGEVTKGRTTQKATHLATAAFGLVANTGNRKATHTAGMIASGIAVTTAFTHFKGLGMKHASGIREL